MATATLESFKAELERLVSRFRENFKSYKNLYGNYKEAEVRLEFLDPFFKALGWDVEYKTGKKDVVVEYPVTESGGHTKSLDYLFRPEGFKPFTCEAKKPIEELDDHAWQAKRYAFCLPTDIATLTDFEEFYIYVVNAPPKKDKPAHQLAQKWHYTNYVECAKELWDLFSKEEVEKGSLEHFVRRKIGAKPVRTQTVDEVFLKELEKSRLNFGKNIFKNNGRKDVFEDNQLNENTQRILDRILFLRICEARGIDTGQTLESICDKSRHSPTSGTSAYAELAKHFQKLGKPTSGVPYFNGNIFSKHPSEDLIIDNHVLLEFIDNLSAETSPYLFEILPIEILGSIYEQFLGKELIAKGSGVAVDQKKTTVKKDTGVYYTPRYIVDYIVEQTLGKQLSEIANGNGQRPSLKDFEKQTSVLKVLDPSCGSGSFLIRAFERICEHWERRLENDLPLKDAPNRAAWEKEHRTHCYIDPQRDAVFLTVGLKKKILLDNIYGVDIDSAAVEVTQLSLYLKMLEHETKTTLGKQKDLFPSDIAVLPALKDNIKCGNSLISSNFSALPEDLTRVNAFDWSVQFEAIMKDGGFDTVIGNPPWGANVQTDTRRYFQEHYPAVADFESYQYFLAKCLVLLAPRGLFGLIIPNTFALNVNAKSCRDHLVENIKLLEILDLSDVNVFKGVSVRSLITIFGFTEDKVCRVLRSPQEFSSSNEVRSLSQVDLRTAETWKAFLVKETPFVHLVSRLAKQFPPLSEYCVVRQGYIPYRTTTLTRRFGEVEAQKIVKTRRWHSDKKVDANYKQELQGADVGRFEVKWSGVWVRYGEWLSTHLPISVFTGPRILVREITGKLPRALMAAYTDKVFVHNPSVLAVRPRVNAPDPRFITGVLNCQLMSLIFSQRASKADKGLFPKIIISDAKLLPFPVINQNDTKSTLAHDRIVLLVDKMLDLTPKMRTAKLETDKATLQNAITATDYEIDRLVYDLYGLTEDEIKLVEESSANNK